MPWDDLTVGERWQKIALLYQALTELSQDVPEDIRTNRQHVLDLKELVLRWVTLKPGDNLQTFRLACDILGIDPREIRRALAPLFP
jgi:hypothetical protein